MKRVKSFCICIQFCCLAVLIAAPITARAQTSLSGVTYDQLEKVKKFYDDTRPVLLEYGPKQIMSPGDYAKFVRDVPTMKAKWAELVGFRAPDVVGKIAPEIKPGKYTYQDKEKYPGLKTLMIPAVYERLFQPGTTAKIAGCIAEFEVVPTQQVYFSTPVAEAALKNKGKTLIDSEGFLQGPVEWAFPFPQPSGSETSRAKQILYNYLHPHRGTDEGEVFFRFKSFTGINENADLKAISHWGQMTGRVTSPPFGILDQRAKKMKEWQNISLTYVAPRDQYGNVVNSTYRIGAVPDLWVYSGTLRRLRKLSGSDGQDTVPGVYVIYDDYEGYNRMPSRTIHPKEYRIIGDREYLVPWYSTDGRECISSRGKEYVNIRMERRPTYVIEQVEKDPTYVYGKTILYIDKETFTPHWIENYDRNGRLWRTAIRHNVFFPDLGLMHVNSLASWDMIAMESSLPIGTHIPLVFKNTREFFSLQNMARRAPK